ncbi:ImmA/IrrE family metallo-endopeptidase [Chromohalobacter sp. HP20-39]|uniref:ImmA/IrrE family metallo-endopeptidase n=1 Tax=Chromohalobacter sp. HP20-39 TaxID=3079306 RepID=UPI00294B71C4|nr:ImmA/IrrE family metallo-endopeptidase [Chromohalobacter sp. HP20-39]MDV6318679.1 ImmA/IrrE family metallo-endopeptidase [Chromohalobacter sp. HP20-39]
MTTDRILANPELLHWSLDRAGLEVLDLTGRFPKLPEWLSQESQPTLRQLEQFARAVHVPIGYLFLPAPPEEPLPIPDFRTLAGRQVTRPSPNLLDAIYLCQQRQDWFTEYARVHGLAALDFVGSANTQQSPEQVANGMREKLGLSIAERQNLSTWTDALRQMISQAEAAGVLVMASSIVGSNSHRKLDVAEFRGFALADALAPLVFINAADSKAAQMFTLAHELAHIWLGESGVSDPDTGCLPEPEVERWCNAVAAEFLVPLEHLQQAYQPEEDIKTAIQRLARSFKVSTLVILRRLFDAGFIEQGTLWQSYQEELARIRALDTGGSGGGDFYRTLSTRTGKNFARAVVSSTLEGQTLFQDAFRMLGVRKTATFYETARQLGVLL